MAPAAGLRGLRARLQYAKLGPGPLRLLLFESGYHVQAEVGRGLEQLGHSVCRLQVGLGAAAAHGVGEATGRMLRALATFRPDVVVTINHIGLDRGGEMAALLAELNVPIIAWYVDCPFLVHDGNITAAPDHTLVFVWERTLVPLMRRAGWPNVGWLPLAACRASFAPGSGPAPAAAHPVCFVGSSMQGPLDAWWARLDAAGRRQAIWEARQLREGGRAAFPARLGLPEASPDPRMTALAWGTYHATAVHRAALLKRAAEVAPLTVRGDAGWASWLPQVPRAGGVAYGPLLAAAYRATAININITSLQMPTAVNQRVFDAPAAGGFLLSDAQEDMEALFPPEARATFTSADECADKVSFFCCRTHARERVTQAAHRTVQARHTYDRRLTTMLEEVRRFWRQRSGDHSTSADSARQVGPLERVGS